MPPDYDPSSIASALAGRIRSYQLGIEYGYRLGLNGKLDTMPALNFTTMGGFVNQFESGIKDSLIHGYLKRHAHSPLAATTKENDHADSLPSR